MRVGEERKCRPVLRAAASTVLVVLASCAIVKKYAYEGPGRDETQQPARVVSELALSPGDRVADLGAGGGYFTFRLADAVGPSGKVYAVDVDPDMTELVSEMAEERRADQVEVILAKPHDPMLPEGRVDLVFSANTYHEISDRVTYFTRLKRSLSERGRVAIVDHNEEAGAFVRWSGHISPSGTIEREMAQAGYRVVEEKTFLEDQTFLILAPVETASR
jgi:ubiquinone/menaquinone biosynthesis C-methylase UbiE